MEILSFYWISIIAAMLLVFILGHIGRHLVARNQSMEIMLLGQEFQSAILIAALIIGFFETAGHDDHNIHLESIVSLFIVLAFHAIYLSVIKRKRSYRIEGAISFIVLLMGLSHFVVLLSPIVEFHMVKSFFGDIVTVSRVESIIACIAALFAMLLFFHIRKNLGLDTIEIALFNKVTKKRNSQIIFAVLVLIMMLFSIHLFGTLFTVGSMIIPAFISGLFGLNKKSFNLLMVVNLFSVPFAFYIINYHDRLPTTVVILFLLLLNQLLGSFILKGKK